MKVSINLSPGQAERLRDEPGHVHVEREANLADQLRRAWDEYFTE